MSRRPVFTSARADDDIAAAIDYYRGEGESAAAAGFVDELEAVFRLIGEHPSIGSTRFALETRIDQLRSTPLRHFPYLVFFVERGDAVTVVRVLHTRRDLPAELQIES